MNIPQSTYRLQFSPDFGFRQAESILPYLNDLGISDIYASPIFKARAGSSHGYDIIDFRQINPELGTWLEFQSLQDRRRSLCLGWLQDIVPNHMAYSYLNPFVRDVMEKGNKSRYNHFFDIDWDHPSPNLDHRITAPFLGQFYGQALRQGDLKIGLDKGTLVVKYFDLKFPLNLRTYPNILGGCLEQPHKISEGNKELFDQIKTVMERVRFSLSLPLTEQEELTTTLQSTLWSLWQNDEGFREWLEETLESINENHLDNSWGLLDSILRAQHYQLSFWQTAGQEINYRRFFNINDLICLKVEDQDVFENSHAFILDLYEQGYLSGLRIDHLDGLYRPESYLKQLRQKSPEAYIIVEKILDLDETIKPDWPIQGTTGYDFLNQVNLIFCCSANKQRFDELTRELSDFKEPSLEHHIRQQKAKVLDNELSGEIDNLARLIHTCLSRTKSGRDIPLRTIQEMVRLVFIFFPVYRTYIDSMTPPPSETKILKQTLGQIVSYNPQLTWPVQCLERHLLCQESGLSMEMQKNWLDCLLRLQQLTGPVMAKGFEDTFLFSFPRLISLNEVGSHPPRFGHSLKTFHDFMSDRAIKRPDSLNTLSTHDTKHGEDLRARINVLSEIPEEWREMVLSWRQLNAGYRQSVQDKIAPTKTDEYILYQILLGVLPFNWENSQELLTRLHGYAIKAIREAKTHSSWHAPNQEYEQSVCSFLSGILDPLNHRFLASLDAFQKKIAFHGCLNSLSQNLIRLTAPGVPDMFQGTEMWTLHMVDPDNRRLVDFQYHQNCLDSLKEEKNTSKLLNELLTSYHDGRIKLYQTWQALWTRRQEIDLFQKGHYIPLATKGSYQNNIVAFTRSVENRSALVVVPRFSTQVTRPETFPLGREIWQDTSIAVDKSMPRDWIDIFSRQCLKVQDKQLQAGDVLRHFPVALMISE